MRAPAETLERRRGAQLLVAERWQTVLGATGICIMLGAAAAIAAGAAAEPSFLVLFGRDEFPGWLAGPFRGVGLPALSQGTFTLLVLGMCAGYAVALAAARALPPAGVVTGVLGVHVVFLLAPPLLSTDLFGYLEYARLGAVHDLNPYLHGGDEVPGDPLRRFSIWHDDPSPYGPLFTALTYPLAELDLRTAAWAVKLAAAVASLGCVALTWRCARRLGRDPRLPALLVGLNPVLLVWGVGGAHNDLLLMLLVIVGVERLLALRERTAGVALAAAAAVKASGGLVLPYALAAGGHPWRVLAGAAAGGIAVLAVGLAVLGPDVLAEYPSAVASQQELASNYSVPTYLGELVGLGGATDGLRVAALAGFAVAALALLAWTARGGDWITASGWSTLALLLATAWLMPWYLVWLLPLAALSASRLLVAAALAMTAFVVWSRLLT